MKRLPSSIVLAALAGAVMLVFSAMIAPVIADEQPDAPAAAPLAEQALERMLAAVTSPTAKAQPGADELLTQSRANYAALKTYADTGAVFTELKLPGGPLVAERHTFTTYYRGPRQFLLDFKEEEQAGGDRFVIWSDGGDFNTWWLTTGVHERYAKGQGATAFALAVLPTKGSSAQTPPLLFANAGLHGPLADLAKPDLAGIEEVSGKRCHKLTGEVGLAYGTGTVTSTRPTAVWIDAETLLVRKIVEDAATGSVAGSVDRITTTFEPQVNPKLDDAQFRFAPPK